MSSFSSWGHPLVSGTNLTLSRGLWYQPCFLLPCVWVSVTSYSCQWAGEPEHPCPRGVIKMFWVQNFCLREDCQFLHEGGLGRG